MSIDLDLSHCVFISKSSNFYLVSAHKLLYIEKLRLVTTRTDTVEKFLSRLRLLLHSPLRLHLVIELKVLFVGRRFRNLIWEENVAFLVHLGRLRRHCPCPERRVVLSGIEVARSTVKPIATASPGEEQVKSFLSSFV